MAEEDGHVNVTMQLSGERDISLSFTFFTSAGSATGKASVLHTSDYIIFTFIYTTANQDYLSTRQTLTFDPNTTSLSALVTVLDDTIREENETFSILISGNSHISTQPISEATVEIVDEDSEFAFLQ